MMELLILALETTIFLLNKEKTELVYSGAILPLKTGYPGAQIIPATLRLVERHNYLMETTLSAKGKDKQFWKIEAEIPNICFFFDINGLPIDMNRQDLNVKSDEYQTLVNGLNQGIQFTTDLKFKLNSNFEYLLIPIRELIPSQIYYKGNQLKETPYAEGFFEPDASISIKASKKKPKVDGTMFYEGGGSSDPTAGSSSPIEAGPGDSPTPIGGGDGSSPPETPQHPNPGALG